MVIPMIDCARCCANALVSAAGTAAGRACAHPLEQRIQIR
jgi:hypothetical protein